ncbi:MAG: hypothetical protein KGQ41_08620 [Alphaproteobacteria bacterium]|nr:hypothetical protein [Alphaproteobacteria bacterium]
MRLFYQVLAFCGVFALCACAGVAPVPGGTDAINPTYYASETDFKTRVGQLQAGMPEEHVLTVLGRGRDELKQLSRNEILTALYGSNTTQSLGAGVERERTIAFMQSLYGYQLRYKDVAKDHGFVNPFRIRTEEEGFDYTVNLIFKDGALLEKPDLSGGVVHERSSSTFFDYLNPGSIIGRVP